MNISQKARSASIGVLEALLLAGCATTAPNTQESLSESSPSTSGEQSATASPEDTFATQVETGDLSITVLEVIDSKTFVVGPLASDSDLAGRAIVEVRPDSSVSFPAEGACGYDEAAAFATNYFAENPENAYVTGGYFGSDDYFGDVVLAGFAFQPGGTGSYAILQEDAQRAGSGLWASCPDFGV
jgi:hypothetical protein